MRSFVFFTMQFLASANKACVNNFTRELNLYACESFVMRELIMARDI